MARHVSQAEAAIVARLVRYFSQTAVARALGRSRTTVCKHAREPTAKRMQRPSNKRVTQRRQLVITLAKEVIEKSGRRFPRYASARSIKSALFHHHCINVSSRTVNRDLHASDFVSRVRRPVPTRDASDREKRQAFCDKWLKKSSTYDFYFSDECWLTCIETTGRTMWVPRGQAPLPIEKKCRYNVGSVMIWACIGRGFRSPLIFFPRTSEDDDGIVRKGWSLNGPAYIKRCLSRVVSHLQKPNVIFVQDGARAHFNRQVLGYLSKKGVRYLTDWPSSSPDLNMIELIWSLLKSKIGQRCPMTVKELMEVAAEEWQRIPVETVDNFISHFTAVLRSTRKEVK